MTDAFIGLGGNLGDRAAMIAAAVERLDDADGVRVVRVAPVIETDPVGPPGQGKYLNTVACVETGLSARELLDACLAVEDALGRERGERWGPRVIDLDLLLFGDAVIDEPGLTVPHPEMHRRRFVLDPLHAVAPEARHPLLGLTAAEMTVRLDNTERKGGKGRSFEDFSS